MKGIVEQYARGEFNVERPDIDISIAKLELAVEAARVRATLGEISFACER